MERNNKRLISVSSLCLEPINLWPLLWKPYLFNNIVFSNENGFFDIAKKFFDVHFCFVSSLEALKTLGTLR